MPYQDITVGGVFRSHFRGITEKRKTDDNQKRYKKHSGDTYKLPGIYIDDPGDQDPGDIASRILQDCGSNLPVFDPE